MTKQSIFLGLAALVAGGVLLSTQVQAYRGNPQVYGPNYTAERHEAMEKAFEANDYEGWKKLMEGRGGRVLSVVNKSNFSEFAKAHEYMENGNIEASNKIRESLGLGNHDGSGQGNGMGRGRYNQ